MTAWPFTAVVARRSITGCRRGRSGSPVSKAPTT